MCATSAVSYATELLWRLATTQSYTTSDTLTPPLSTRYSLPFVTHGRCPDMGGARIITGAGGEESQAIFLLRARPETDEGKLFVCNLWSAVRPPTCGCVSESYAFAVTRYRIYLMHSGDDILLACSTFKADEYTRSYPSFLIQQPFREEFAPLLLLTSFARSQPIVSCSGTLPLADLTPKWSISRPVVSYLISRPAFILYAFPPIALRALCM